MADDLVLVLDTGQDDQLVLDGETDETLEFGAPVITDYDKLQSRPKINNVVLTGNKFLRNLFPDGIIIDGGTSEGAV